MYLYKKPKHPPDPKVYFSTLNGCTIKDGTYIITNAAIDYTELK